MSDNTLKGFTISGFNTYPRRDILNLLALESPDAWMLQLMLKTCVVLPHLLQNPPCFGFRAPGITDIPPARTQRSESLLKDFDVALQARGRPGEGGVSKCRFPPSLWSATAITYYYSRPVAFASLSSIFKFLAGFGDSSKGKTREGLGS